MEYMRSGESAMLFFKVSRVRISLTVRILLAKVRIIFIATGVFFEIRA